MARTTLALRVALVWHGTVLAERHIARGAVRVGSHDADFVAPLEPHTLFVVAGSGAQLLVPADARVQLNGCALGTHERMVHVEHDDWGFVDCGSYAFYFQWVHEATLPQAPPGDVVDSASTSATLLSAAAHTLFVIAAFLLAEPSVAPFGRLDASSRHVSIVVDAPPEPLLEWFTSAPDAAPPAGAPADPAPPRDDARAPAAPTATGERAAAPPAETDATPSVTPGVAISAVGAQLDIFATTLGQDALHDVFRPQNPARVAAPFVSAGEDGGLLTSRGTAGLASRGTGRGGRGGPAGHLGDVAFGAMDTSGSGSARLRRREAAPRADLRIGTPVGSPVGLTSPEIERVVRRHHRGIRHCYERQLSAESTLSGRVTAQWTIGLDGRVAQATIAEDTLRSAEVSDCILAEIRRMRFPEARGAMAVVAYPFTFRRAD